MELFQELLITVGISLLVSFVIAKLFSMASPSDATTADNNSASVSISRAIEQAVFCAQKRDEKSTRVCFVDEAVKFVELGKEESSAETIGSSSNFDDDEVVASREDSEASEGVGLENKILGGSILIEAAKIGGVECEEKSFDESSEKEKSSEVRIESDDAVELISEIAKFREIEIESGRDEVNVGKIEEARVLESEDINGNESDGVVSNAHDGGEEGAFDDWEGIERTELEKRFGDAVVFVGSKSNADCISRLDSDTKMQFYGLHKLAIEGTCSVPSPMAFKVSARAKWNAWQQLGDMSREVAMEQYISILSRSIPGWMGYDAKGYLDATSTPFETSILQNQHVTQNESTSTSGELKPGDEGCGMIGGIQTP